MDRDRKGDSVVSEDSISLTQNVGQFVLTEMRPQLQLRGEGESAHCSGHTRHAARSRQ